MAAGGGDGGAQTVTWIIAIGGIAISLGWNAFNQWKTGKVAKDIRAEQFEADRWARLRTRIEIELAELVDGLRSAHVVIAQIEAQGQPSDAAMDVLGHTIINAHDDLARVLREADEADFCDGCEWEQLALGKTYTHETSWDLISTVIADATERAPDRVSHLKRLKRYSNEIEELVRQAIKAQDALLDPRGGSS